MKVIQLRGTNATGKTSTIRQFIDKGDFVVKSINMGARDIDYHWDERRKICVVGRYDQAMSGGIDGYITNKDFLRDVIVRIVKSIKPEVLLFEGIVYGVTFKFAYELQRLLNRWGVEYIGICLNPPLNVVFDRLAIRNGDKPVDYMSVQNKWFTANRAYEKLKRSGVNVKTVDTSNIPKELMYKIIEDEI